MNDPDYAYLWVKFMPHGDSQAWSVFASDRGPYGDFAPEWPWYKLKIPVPRELVAKVIDVPEQDVTKA